MLLHFIDLIFLYFYSCFPFLNSLEINAVKKRMLMVMSACRKYLMFAGPPAVMMTLSRELHKSEIYSQYPAFCKLIVRENFYHKKEYSFVYKDFLKNVNIISWKFDENSQPYSNISFYHLYGTYIHMGISRGYNYQSIGSKFILVIEHFLCLRHH